MPDGKRATSRALSTEAAVARTHGVLSFDGRHWVGGPHCTNTQLIDQAFIEFSLFSNVVSRKWVQVSTYVQDIKDLILKTLLIVLTGCRVRKKPRYTPTTSHAYNATLRCFPGNCGRLADRK